MRMAMAAETVLWSMRRFSIDRSPMLKSVAILTSEEERMDVAVARVRARAIKR